jgi:hypothetical protein
MESKGEQDQITFPLVYFSIDDFDRCVHAWVAGACLRDSVKVCNRESVRRGDLSNPLGADGQVL